MPGGKGNIKPEDGLNTQFSSENQPEEKWTLENAMQLGRDLITWQKEDNTHIFYDEFLYIEKDYYSGLISYLCEKFTPFSKLIERSKKIQEIKLKKFGTADKLNAAITKFVLINEHNWRDKQELTGADGKDLNTSIQIEIIDNANQVNNDSSSR
jgi:hypothetical protein